MNKILLASVVAVGLLISTDVHATNAALITVESDGAATTSFTPFVDTPGTIGSVAAGDLGSDGTAEIIVGAGSGLPPKVAVFRQDGSMIGEFLAYAESFHGGVNVAVCDVDGDGTSEIVTGARIGGGPHVRIFSNTGDLKYAGFFAYAEDFRGGVHVACGDIDGDGIGDIVTGAGPTGGPHLKMFDQNGRMKYEVFNGNATQNSGSYVRVINDTVYAAPIGSTDETVTSFRVAMGELRPVESQSRSRTEFFSTTAYGNTTATADIESELYGDLSPHLLLVDISEQRLYAYEYGMQVNTFLISSGMYGYDTPYGNFSVLAKVPVVDYIGADYSYPDTPWNLRFKPHYYLHTAYWHDDFGRRKSHGCVNISETNAKWLYDWSSVNTPVNIVP